MRPLLLSLLQLLQLAVVTPQFLLQLSQLLLERLSLLLGLVCLVVFRKVLFVVRPATLFWRFLFH